MTTKIIKKASYILLPLTTLRIAYSYSYNPEPKLERLGCRVQATIKPSLFFKKNISSKC